MNQRQASKWRVPPGTLNHPISIFLFRLFAPLRWLQGTTVHIAVYQCCKLPLRILAIRSLLSKRLSATARPLPSTPPFSGFEAFYIAGTQKLWQEKAWCDELDLQIWEQAFRQGAILASGNVCTKSDSEEFSQDSASQQE